MVDRETVEEFKRRVTPAATGLIVAGLLGFMGNCVLGFALPSIRQNQGPVRRPVGMDDDTFAAYESGRDAAVFLDCCGLTLPCLFVFPLIMLGGFQMVRMQTYWLAVTAAILAMLPCSAACVVNLPLGIWALVVLLNPEIRGAFYGRYPLDPSFSPPGMQ